MKYKDFISFAAERVASALARCFLCTAPPALLIATLDIWLLYAWCTAAPIINPPAIISVLVIVFLLGLAMIAIVLVAAGSFIGLGITGIFLYALAWPLLPRGSRMTVTFHWLGERIQLLEGDDLQPALA